MHKTTVVLDEILVDQVLKLTGLSSMRQAIEAGLHELLRKHRRQALVEALGSFDLDLDPVTLDHRRADRTIDLPDSRDINDPG